MQQSMSQSMERYSSTSQLPLVTRDSSRDIVRYSDMGRDMRDMMQRHWQEMQRQMDSYWPESGRRWLEPTWCYDVSPMSSMRQSVEGRFREMEREMTRRFDQFARTSGSLSEPFLHHHGIVTGPDGSQKLSLEYDLRNFSPEDLTVKTDDRTLTVHARKDESKDGNRVMREFSRSMTLPAGVKPAELTSVLSQDGVLKVEAPLPAIEASKPREDMVIPIQHKSPVSAPNPTSA